MRRNLIINLISSSKSEIEILSALRNKVGKHAIEKPKKPEKISPIGLAAAFGYTEVLKYLIDEKGADPNEVTLDNTTALDVALLNLHKEAALYLISKTNHFIIDLEQGGYQSMIFAIATNDVEVVKKLHESDPKFKAFKNSVDNKVKNTLLHFAVFKKADKVFEYLLELEKAPSSSTSDRIDIYSPNYEGLAPIHYIFMLHIPRILSLLLQSDFIPTRSLLYQGKEFSHLEAIISGSDEHIDVSEKLQCIYLLLAAGAGLDGEKIPDGVLRLLKRKREEVKPFLLLGYDDSASNTRKRLINAVETFKNKQSLPNWRFELRQLALFTSDPTIENLPHVVQLRRFLPEKYHQIQRITNVESKSDCLPIIIPIDQVKCYSQYDLLVYANHQFNRLVVLRDTFNEKLKKIIEDRISSKIDQEALLQLTPAAHDYYNSFSHIIDFLALKNANEIKKLANGTYFNVLIDYLHEEHSTLVFVTHNCIIDFEFLEGYFFLLNEIFKKIIREKAIILAKNLPELLIDLLITQALVQFVITKYYIEGDEEETVFSLSFEAINTLNKTSDKFCLKGAEDLDRATAFFKIALAWVYHRQGYFQEAYLQIMQAIPAIDEIYLEDDFVNEMFRQTVESAIQKDTTMALKLLGLLMSIFKQADLDKSEKKHRKEYFIAKYEEVKNTVFSQSAVLFKSNFSCFGDVSIALGNTIYLVIKEQYLHSENMTEFNCFLKDYHSIVYCAESRTMSFSQDFILFKDFERILSRLSKILNLKIGDCSGSVAWETELTERFTRITLNNNEPLEQDIVKNKKEPVQKEVFKQLEGYSPVVPIYGGTLPENALFLAICDKPEFQPFFKLIKQKDSDLYCPIRAIASKGVAQQGVKLYTKWILVNRKKEKISIARLKVYDEGSGATTLRARGGVVLEKKSSEGKHQKLYLIDQVFSKKEEKRKKTKKMYV